VGFQIVGGVLGVASVTAVAVHHLDQAEFKRIEDKAATDIARVEGERRLSEEHWKAQQKLSEEHWKAQVERYRYDLQLMHSQDYAPYQTAIVEKRKKRGGTGGLEKEEETD